MGNTIKAISERVNNVFHYAAVNEAVFEAQMADFGKGQRQTTFFSDLSIAEWCGGEEGVKDTYKRVMKSWMSNLGYILEFAISLNWKSWQHYEDGNEDMCEVYAQLWESAQSAIYDHYRNDKEATSRIWEYFD